MTRTLKADAGARLEVLTELQPWQDNRAEGLTGGDVCTPGAEFPATLGLWGFETHTYRWGNNPVRAALKGRRCRILASGKLGSILVEFEDGSRYITSRRAVRRIV